MGDIAAQRGARTKPPSLLACIACRKAHLKCDGRKPLCARCADKKLECVWMESRRGYRDNRTGTDDIQRPQGNPRMPTSANASIAQCHRPEPSIPTNPLGPEFVGGSYVLDPGVAAGQTYTYQELFRPILTGSPSRAHSELPSLLPSPPEMSSPTSTSSTTSMPRDLAAARHGDPIQAQNPSDLIDIYYKFFHPAHPFLVPRKLARLRPTLLPEPLKAVMRFIGCHHAPQWTSNRSALQKAASAILSDNVPDDGFKVQGLILYCIICFADCDQMQGGAALDQAIEIALRIGMNLQSYSTINSPSDPVLQESWRRTWWMLFIMEGIVTAVGGQAQPFRLYHVFSDVALPGDCQAYANLKSTPNPPSLATFRGRIFSQDNVPYSSLTYAIEAMYIMGAVFAMGPDTFAITHPQVETIDTSISSFLLSLPPSMREVIESDGVVDEPLLLAHLLINWSSILLHRPRSTLTFIRNHYATVCTKKETCTMPALAYASHTSKTLRAANNIISLASLQRPLAYATPILMCGVTTAATVHLPAYAIAEDNSQALAIKERLQLTVATLGQFAEIWGRADIAKSQVATFAREVLTRPNVSVDSSGFGFPKTISTNNPEELQLPGFQAQLEYQMGLNADDQWMQNILLQSETGEGNILAANTDRVDKDFGFPTST